MITTSNQGRSGWRNWYISAWNASLFQYFFLVGDDPSPVSRLVITAEVMRRVVGDDGADACEVRNAFLDCIRGRLRNTRQSLCRDALSLPWNRNVTSARSIPPFFSHLVVTCLAASDAGDDGPLAGHFRVRLKSLLDRETNDPNYPLNELPYLWQSLQAWLAKAREQGEPYRALVLPNPGHLSLIGYSVGLAFPSHKDQATLIELLAAAGLPDPAPVLAVLQCIQRGLGWFSERFQQAFYEFRRAHVARTRDLHNWPIWSAVEEALLHVRVCNGRAAPNKRPRPLLRLLRDEDWRLVLVLQVDGMLPGEYPSGLTVEPAEELVAGPFDHRLDYRGAESSSNTVGHLLLRGDLQRLIPALGAADLYHAVDEGVLLFAEDEDGVWRARFYRPDGGEVRGLVRSDLVGGLTTALVAIGGCPRSTPAIYPGWHEVERIDGGQLGQVDLTGTVLGNVRCLQEVLRPTIIHLQGGVRINGGWLGRYPALPEVIVEGCTRVTLERRGNGDGNDPAPTLELAQHQIDAHRWTIPGDSVGSSHLDGPYSVQAFGPSELRATRRADFHSHFARHDFALPSVPELWLGESGSGVATLSREGLGPCGIADDKEPTGFLLGPIKAARESDDQSKMVECETLLEVLAALALRRRWLPLGDVLEWMSRILGIDGELLWDVHRGWLEAGYLDCYSYRRWRKRCCFARRPRFVAHRRAGRPDVVAVLQGLSTAVVSRQVVRAAAERGAQVERVPGVSPWVPCPLTVRTTSWSELEGISSEAGLEPPQWLLPLERCVSSVLTVSAQRTTLMSNHVLVGQWNWRRVRFEASDSSELDDVSIEWYRRADAPDAYVVRKDGRTAWTGEDRNWALLIAYTLRKEQPYGTSSSTLMARVQPSTAHLPLPVGRWATAATGIAPGPIPVGHRVHSYAYDFGTSHLRDMTLRVLWPGVLSDVTAQRARWLASVLRGRLAMAADGLVRLPTHVQAVLRAHSPAGAESLRMATLVPKCLLPQFLVLADALQSAHEETSASGLNP